MDWKEIEKCIREIVDEIKNDCVIKNTAIRDDIFGILEDNCTVIYYPLEKEKNRGFHIKRIVNDKLEDFVYINTAKPIEEQIFTAAHELGHIFEVFQKVYSKIANTEGLSESAEEDITNRFAAELLMPYDAFKNAFLTHMHEISVNPEKVKLEELIRVIVMQMSDFMVPYEAVVRRMVEVELIPNKLAEFLGSIEAEILGLVGALTKEQNTYLDNGTGVKTISGIRSLIEAVESKGTGDSYLIMKIKKELDIVDMHLGKTCEINIGDGKDE